MNNQNTIKDIIRRKHNEYFRQYRLQHLEKLREYNKLKQREYRAARRTYENE